MPIDQGAILRALNRNYNFIPHGQSITQFNPQTFIKDVGPFDIIKALDTSGHGWNDNQQPMTMQQAAIKQHMDQVYREAVEQMAQQKRAQLQVIPGGLPQMLGNTTGGTGPRGLKDLE
jgi:hypothetical protein